MKDFCFSKNEIAPSKNATIHPMDIGLIRGYGIFDFFRTANYKALFLSDYLDRFIRSAEKTNLQLRYTKSELSEIIQELIKRNDLEAGGIRMMLSGGVSENHFTPQDGSLFIFCEELDFPSSDKYVNGIKLLATEHIRAIADVKTTNYAYPVWHSAAWKKQGAEDVLYHMNGYISESSRSNIFIIKDGKIATPDKHILHGITRKRVLELDNSIEIRPITLEEILDADEAFITSTTKKILPVSKIDDTIIGEGKTGKVTKDLIDAFSKMEQKSSE